MPTNPPAHDGRHAAQTTMRASSLAIRFKWCRPAKHCATVAITLAALGIDMVTAAADDAAELGHQISGTIIIEANEYSPQPDERLIIKFFYPDQGIEKDQTFRIFSDFTFPFTFNNGPDLDMSRRTKWSTYVVEAYTDIDGDVLSVTDREYFASTNEPVAIGSEGLLLKLSPPERTVD